MSGVTRAACEKCGTPVMRGARFCAACGTEVSNPQVDTAATSTMLVSNTAVLRDKFLETLRDITLGEYEILLEVGSGGMASVYLAHDIQLDRKVAIKAMHPQLLQGEGMVERFRLEARTVAQLSHSNIVPIYAVKQEQDLLLFVMKFIEGQALDAIIKTQAPLPAPMVTLILSRVADALGYAHRHGVIHRDIKPANIMVDVEGVPVVTDFGIAKVANTEGLTLTGAAIGTPHYMSPEQCHAMPLTGATDQYSLGVTAYQMITGALPFEGGSAMNIMFKHAHEPPPPLRDRAPDCPPELAAVIERMLAKKPEDRFARMEDVVRALNAPTMAHDDPVRSQLIQFALAGENRRLLKRVSTPKSPIPSVVAGGGPASRRAASAQPAAATRTVIVAPPSAPASRRNLALVGGGVLAAVLLAVLAVTRPWQRPAPSSETLSQATLGDTTGAHGGPGTPASDSAKLAAALTDSAARVKDSASAVPPPATVKEKPAESTTPVEVAPTPVRPKPRPNPPAPSPAELRLPPLQSVQLSGPSAMTVGDNATIEADPIDGAGRVVSGRQIQWKSSAPEIASIGSGGQVVARQPGRVVITAVVESVSGSMTITVQAPAAASVSISPTDLTLEVGETGALTAAVGGGSGRPADRAVQWSSGAPQVASVNADGVVTAKSPGLALIAASAAGRQATATVKVVAAGPSEADLRSQAADAIQAYARAIESRDVARVRQIYPTMASTREQQLKQALPNMKNLQVRLSIADLQITGDNATAVVTGKWQFESSGKRTDIPADNTYQLVRRGNGWVITEIR